MNFDAPPKRRWGRVGLWVLAIALFLLLTVVFGGYYAVMHTSLPFKMFEAMIASGGTNSTFKVEGITGSISNGFLIRAIRWGNPGEESVIQDVHVSYKGFWNLMGGRRIVFQDIHIGKAHLDITGLEQMNAADAAAADSDEADKPDPSQALNPAWTNANAWRASRGGAARSGPQWIEIDRAGVEDVFLTNRVTGFSLSIPTMEWKGFRASNGVVELGTLTIDSDRLKVETRPGETVVIDGKPVVFDKTLAGTILPRLHPAVRKPIPFTVHAGYQTNLLWHFTALEGHIEAFHAGKGSGYLRCQEADVSGSLDAPVPTRLSLEIAFQRKSGKTQAKIGPGGFALGKSAFEIQPMDWDNSAGALPTNLLTAASHSASGTFRYQLAHGNSPWSLRQVLTADPPLAADETVSLVLYGKRVADLTEQEKQRLDADQAWFAGRKSKTNSVPVKPEVEVER